MDNTKYYRLNRLANCFSKSFEISLKLSNCEDVRLVHGVIVQDQGFKILHAWIEIKDVILDMAGNKKTITTKDIYYKKHKIEKVYRYTFLEAVDIATKYCGAGNQHHGPWENDLYTVEDVIYHDKFTKSLYTFKNGIKVNFINNIVPINKK